jgi:hypothetical protein
MKFTDLLRGAWKRAETSADIIKALATIEAERPAIAERFAALTEKRRAALLDGASEAVDAIEAEQQQLSRTLDQLDAIEAELDRRKGEAERRERIAATEAAYNRAAECQRRGVELLQKYGSNTRKLAALLAEIVALDTERESLNAALAAAGDPRRVDAPESAIAIAGKYTTGTANRVLLPNPANPHDPMWDHNTARRVAAAARKSVEPVGETSAAAA